jgi:predicted acetyltransferase
VPSPPLPPHFAEPKLTYLEEADTEAFLAAVLRGFHDDFNPDLWEPFQKVQERDRAFGFTIDGRWIATCGAYSRSMTVPGGRVPTAAVTVVTVSPTFRRRGLLTAMMKHQLEDIHRRSEPVALLWASESLIYGRFGYGHATPRLRISGQTPSTAFLPGVDLGGGSVGEVERDEWLAAAIPLYDRLLAQRPGSLNRDANWWQVRVHDPEPWRRGAAALRFALHYDRSGQVDGFASFRVKGGDAGDGPAAEVQVADIEAGEPSAYAALWRFLLDLDLVRTFTRQNAPVDEPLRYLVADSRMIATELTDSTYARLVDVPAALEARTYAADLDVVMEVSDSLLPHNDSAFRLRAGPDGAEASATRRRADVSLSVRDLGAIYLGGTQLSSLHAAGLVAEHTTGTVAAITAAFSAPRPPFCPDQF